MRVSQMEDIIPKLTTELDRIKRLRAANCTSDSNRKDFVWGLLAEMSEIKHLEDEGSVVLSININGWSDAFCLDDLEKGRTDYTCSIKRAIREAIKKAIYTHENTLKELKC